MGERISVRVTDEMRAEIDARAARAGVSRAEAIRLLLKGALSASLHDGVDRTQIARRLAMSPAQRIEKSVEETRKLLAVRRRAS